MKQKERDAILERAFALVASGRLTEARELLDWAENQGETK